MPIRRMVFVTANFSLSLQITTPTPLTSVTRAQCMRDTFFFGYVYNMPSKCERAVHLCWSENGGS